MKKLYSILFLLLCVMVVGEVRSIKMISEEGKAWDDFWSGKIDPNEFSERVKKARMDKIQKEAKGDSEEEYYACNYGGKELEKDLLNLGKDLFAVKYYNNLDNITDVKQKNRLKKIWKCTYLGRGIARDINLFLQVRYLKGEQEMHFRGGGDLEFYLESLNKDANNNLNPNYIYVKKFNIQKELNKTYQVCNKIAYKDYMSFPYAQRALWFFIRNVWFGMDRAADRAGNIFNRLKGAQSDSK